MVIDAYTTPGTERETRLSSVELLRQMDSASVDRAVIAPEDREIAVHNVSGNRRVLQLARTSGGRFIPACSVNPWFGADAVSELKRAIDDGARLLVLAPALQGFIMTDGICDGLLTHAGGIGLPVYVHTGPHSSSTPSQLGLVAERFPDCRFILGHGGSTDYSHDMPPLFRLKLPNLWYELSFVRPWAVPGYAKQLGDESKLIFGSSAPRNDLDFELAQFDAQWPIREHPGTYGDNLLKLIAEVRA